MKYLVQIIFYAVILGALVVINLNQLSLTLADDQSPITAPVTLAPITSPLVSPEPSNQPQNNDNHDNGGSSGGNSGPSVCGDQLPGTPVLLSAVKTGPNQVLLNWSKPAGPVSGYVLAYGLTPTKMLYGNPNIGNKNSFVVDHLQAKTAYYFQVSAANGCAAGAFSKSIGVSAYGKAISTKVASGFTPGTLSAAKVKNPAQVTQAAVVPSVPANVTPTPVQIETKAPEVNLSQLVSKVFGKVLSFLYR